MPTKIIIIVSPELWEKTFSWKNVASSLTLAPLVIWWSVAQRRIVPWSSQLSYSRPLAFGPRRLFFLNYCLTIIKKSWRLRESHSTLLSREGSDSLPTRPRIAVVCRSFTTWTRPQNRCGVTVQWNSVSYIACEITKRMAVPPVLAIACQSDGN